MKYKRLGVNVNTTNVRFRCGPVKFLMENKINCSEDFFLLAIIRKKLKAIAKF